MNPSTTEGRHPAYDLMLDQCWLLYGYLCGHGLDLQQTAVRLDQAQRRASDLAHDEPDADRYQVLDVLYAELRSLAAPASPQSIAYVHEQARARHRLRWLAAVPLVRDLLVVAALALVLFLGAGLSGSVHHGSGDLFDSSGWPLAVNELFLTATATLGASLHGLKQALVFIRQRSFDPDHISDYWINIVIGIISGLMLSQLFGQFAASDASLERPLYAFLGGFSADVVYVLLDRLTALAKSLVPARAASDRTVTSPQNIEGQA